MDTQNNEKQIHSIEYYDDTFNSGNFYVCINHHYIFAANGEDSQAEWKFINPNYERWDRVHQRIYRNHKADKISKEKLPTHLPPPPDSIPDEVEVALPKRIPSDAFPALIRHLLTCEGKLQHVYLLLHEDLYESSFGDGKFCNFKTLCFERDAALQFQSKHAERYSAYHIRAGSIALNGERLECTIDKYTFDHFSDEQVFTFIEDMLSANQNAC